MPVAGSVTLRVGILTAAIFLTAAGPLEAQQKVGVNSAVNPQATGAPPGAAARQLVIGQDVVYNEHINTGPAGQSQLLFLDESSMAVGPNSDLTIDQFVYDPKTSTGKLAMSATRGLLRYVGGKLSKQDEAVTLKTSTATLAVRGGAFIVNILPNGSTNAVFIYGKGLTVTSNSGGTQTVTRPGYQTTVTPGSPPSPPAPQPPGQLAQYLQQLDGRSGGNGGAAAIPSDASVVSSGIPQTISGNVNNSFQQAQNQNTGTQAPPPSTNLSGGTNQVQTVAVSGPDCAIAGSCSSSSTSGTSGNQFINSTTSSSGNTGSTGSTSGNGGTTGGTTGGGTGGGTPTTTLTYNGRLRNTNGNGTAQGFVGQTGNADIPYQAGTLSFTQGSPNSGVFTGTFNTNGATLGTLTFPLIPGSATFTGTSSTLGPISGTSFLSPDNTFFYATIIPTNQPSERLFISGGSPVAPATQQGSQLAATGATRIFAFTVQPDAALQSNIPFIRSQAGGNLPNASVSPLYVVAPATTPIGDASTTAAARGLQASLAINGQGANQQSAISVATGTFNTSLVNPNNPSPGFGGQVRGSSLLSANGAPVRIGSSLNSTPDPTGASIYGGNSITGFVLGQTQYVNNLNGTSGAAVVPSTATEASLSGTSNTYGFAQAVVPTTVPNGVGTSRTTQALTGTFGGLMYTTAQSTPYAVQGNTLVSTDASTNRVQATFAGNAQTASSGVNNLTMQFGELTGNTSGAVAFIDNSTFAAHESQNNPQQINGQNLVVNGSTADAGKLYMVTSGAAGTPTQLLPSGASFCQCQYLQWGYWGGDLRTGDNTDSNISRIDRGHINTWIAGTPTPTADLNNLITQSATATYAGAAIGSVFNNGNSYLAAGGFNGTYNFGTQSGTLAISNFDGHSFAATGRAPLNGANYSFASSGSGFSGTLNGSFYGPAAAETGGNFTLQSTIPGVNYLASGTYAGKR